jgi:phosphoribosylamine--glycine ligase
MAEEGSPYSGVLYVGLMLTSEGPKVVEYNCRLGDPETQVVLPLLQGDLVDLLVKASEGNLSAAAPVINSGCAAVVVMAAGGYPGAYAKGLPIQGLEQAEKLKDVQVLHAGTRRSEGHCVTAGGRVLGVVGKAATLNEALNRAYAGVSEISFPECQFRRDIGQKGLRNLVG